MSDDQDNTWAPPPGQLASARPAWRMAEQYFRNADFELQTVPWGDGYVMTLHVGLKRRRVFFDPSGRVTHVQGVHDPSQPQLV